MCDDVQESYMLFVGNKQTVFADEYNDTHENIAKVIFEMVASIREYTQCRDYGGDFSKILYLNSVTSFYKDLYDMVMAWTWMDREWGVTLLDALAMSETIWLRYSDIYLSYVIDIEIKEEFVDCEDE